MAQGPAGRRPERDGGSGGLKAVILIVVVVIVGVVVLSKLNTAHSTASASHHTKTTVSTTTTLPSTTTTTVVSPAKIKVQVLNGVSSTSSYAGSWSKKLAASPGYLTEPAANATSKVSHSEIYILTAGYLAEAEALAVTVGIPTSYVDQQVPPASSAPIPPSARSAANLVLVVGPDLASKA